MATYLHFAPALALAVALGPQRIGWRLTLAGATCAVLPDLDLLMVAMHFDSHSGTYGHRGFTHSLGFALLVGALGALLAGRRPLRSRWLTAAFLALCTASHPLVDGLIDRGICNAWLWPLDGARHCLPWRPVPMQGVSLFGAERLKQELLWIGVPLLVLANAGMLWRWCWRWRRGTREVSALALHGVDRPGRPVGAWGEPLPTDTPRVRRQRRVADVRQLLDRSRRQYRQRHLGTQRVGAG